MNKLWDRSMKIAVLTSMPLFVGAYAAFFAFDLPDRTLGGLLIVAACAFVLIRNELDVRRSRQPTNHAGR